ncbi:MAG TPA: class I SAM-dependent methyltransferase [Stenomitos sp.]
MNCRLCGGKTKFFAVAKLRKKYEISYFICHDCELLQTEEPYWLEEAYADPISANWVGLVSQNINYSHRAQALLLTYFGHRKKYIDYGGGYGLFVRLMRDAGFDFSRFDPFCPNLLAPGFDAPAESAHEYALATAFEVFEHFVEPLAEIQKILNLSSSILFSTNLVPQPMPQPAEWEYYDLENGQHVALYSYKTLQVIADMFKLNLYSNGYSMHLLTPHAINPWAFKMIYNIKVAILMSWSLKKILRVNSLQPRDYAQSALLL